MYLPALGPLLRPALHAHAGHDHDDDGAEGRGLLLPHDGSIGRDAHLLQHLEVRLVAV